MKIRYIILVVFFALGGILPAFSQEKQRHVVDVGDFTQLLVVDNVNVEYHCNPDSTGKAVFSAVPDMVNQIIFDNNKKGRLSISIGTDSVSSGDIPKIVVYSAYLQSAENQGDSTLHITSIAPAPLVKFKLMDNGNVIVDKVEATTVDVEILTGKGKIIVAGKCTNLNVKNTGVGTINTENLSSKDVNCRILGTGKVYCRVDGGHLSIKGSGTGKVYYRGTPIETKSFQLGTIKAISLDNEQD